MDGRLAIHGDPASDEQGEELKGGQRIPDANAGVAMRKCG